ncbi:MAG: DNA-binding protein [Candidatus Bathyarchaeota archaeon]|nr:MAG: DNA-binding protein [Candidatus Bathyarchaeota archaeon]
MLRDFSENRYVCESGKSGQILVTRIKPGSDLLQSIRNIVEDNEVKSGVILSGTGLLCKSRLRNCKTLPQHYPITDVNRSYLAFETPLEILALSGNVSEIEGKPWVHAHIVLSYVKSDRIRVIGGHLIEGSIVFGFTEVVLMEIEGMSMPKKYDDETKTLQLFA